MMKRHDSKPFATYSNTDDIGRMVQRLTDGLTCYKDVDYSKLKSRALEQKFSSHKSLMKLKKFEQVTKQSKEGTLLKQHHLVWRKEFLRLNTTRRRLEHELEAHIQEHSSTPDTNSIIYQEFDSISSSLNTTFAKFKVDTVSPVWCLRDDLQYWLQKNRAEIEICSPEILDASKNIKEAISSVKQQQGSVLERLRNEEAALSQDLNTGYLQEISLHRKCAAVDRGIPEDLFHLPCIDTTLRVAMLQEVLWLDEKYENRLADLDCQHSDVLSSDNSDGWSDQDHCTVHSPAYGTRALYSCPCCRSDNSDGWSDQDHCTFTYLWDQYTADTPNRRQLLIDRLQRHLPHKTRAQLVSHEDWYLSRLHYYDRRHAITTDWSRDKHELVTKAAVVFLESELLHEYDEEKHDATEKQRLYCQQLAERVAEWREMKQEAMALQEELDWGRQKKIQEREKERLEKENQKRQSIKHKIDTYHEGKEKKRREEEEKTQKRLDMLTSLLSQQAVHDTERVQYRMQEREQRLEELRQKGEEMLESEREKEERLEALRKQVRVIAEFDPVRMHRQTENWQHRLQPDPDTDHNIQRPLFDCHSFTSKQITSDKRVKLEEKLRQAGLLHSDYARDLLTKIDPPTQPRKDNVSTVFKHTQES